MLLRAEAICKYFPGVKALDNVSFTLNRSEVHVLLGENGAGKSTLMKIFSGLYMVDAGSIWLEGQLVNIKNPKHSQELGISIIYQEFNLIPHLSVVQNMFLGHEPVDSYGFIDIRNMREKAREIMDFLKVDISLDAKINTLGIAHMQLVEVAKALTVNSRILIMDEPTATLSSKEINNLFETILKLKEKGVSIIYISHRLQEIKQIGDRVTVLRDGNTVGTHDVDKIELDELIHLMVGRKISQHRIRLVNTAVDEIVFAVDGLGQKPKLQNVNLHVRKGEIVALAGLVGAGRTELMHAVFGIDTYDTGKVVLRGKDITRNTPRKAIKAGMGLLPESRKENGLCLIQPIRENITHSGLKRITRFGILSLKKEREFAQTYIKQLNISCPGMNQTVKYLSGGNQQKVVLGKWLFTQCDFLIFDEPTRGIDVGAKSEIYRLLNDLAQQGKSIIMISSELPEILRMSHRIIVMCEGRITGELTGPEATQEKIMKYATQRGANVNHIDTAPNPMLAGGGVS